MSEEARAAALDDTVLAQVEDVLREASGLTLARSVRRSLDTALTRAAESRRMVPTVFLERLLAREGWAVEAFVEHAVIGETYFFRHPEHLRELARASLSRAGILNIWSAGCATGEEPYSIVMSLLAVGVPAERIQVLATDISSRALQRAKAAVYGPWSVRRIEPQLEQRFLNVRGEVVTVLPEARQPVQFRRHNLTQDPVPVSGQDAIFCRNVLIYFPPELAREVITRLIGALMPGGLLFLSPAEVPLANGLGLEPLDAQGTPVLRVPLTGAVPSPVSAPMPEAPPSRRPPPSRKAAPAPPAPSPVALVRPSPPPAPPPEPVAPVAEPAAPAVTEPSDTLQQALAAARSGQYDQAEALAREAARQLNPEAYLLLAMVAEAREDLNAAVEAVRKALYLDPQMALGHATLATLYSRLNRREDAERARQNALRALDGLDDEHQLRGVEAVTAGGLRQALAARNQAGWQGAR